MSEMHAESAAWLARFRTRMNDAAEQLAHREQEEGGNEHLTKHRDAIFERVRAHEANQEISQDDRSSLERMADDFIRKIDESLIRH